MERKARDSSMVEEFTVLQIQKKLKNMHQEKVLIFFNLPLWLSNTIVTSLDFNYVKPCFDLLQFGFNFITL